MKIKILDKLEFDKLKFVPIKRGRPKTEPIIKIDPIIKEQHLKLITELDVEERCRIINWRNEYKEHTLKGLIYNLNEHALIMGIELRIELLAKDLEIERIK